MEKEMKAYTLKEISEWQKELKKTTSEIQLPSLQRGFVWKPNQIEALWDSILRGYPIGAILMSVDSNKNIRFLLDGQQRCTSIALGFFNPLETDSAPKIYLPSVWIDLKPSKDAIKSINQKYCLRVLTKSHPWGYQVQREKNESGKTLTMQDRKNALEYFKNKQANTKYIDLNPSSINPWDAHFPVPLAYLLDIINDDNIKVFEGGFILNLREKIKNLEIQTKHSNGENVKFDSLTNEDLSAIFEGIRNTTNIKIPEITVDANILKEEDDDTNNESQDPTLFVRLNSAGTRIGGEELMYSIYKAAFPEIKELVEEIGLNYIAPSKIINLFSRLVSCELAGYTEFPRDFTINSFRNKIKNDDFKIKLQEYISKNSEALKIIETAIAILQQGKIDIPNIVIKQFIVSFPDLFLVLLIYIKKYDLHNSDFQENEIKDISSSYVYLLWFGLDNKKIPTSLFTHLFKTEKIKWSDAVKELLRSNLVIPLLDPELLRETLLNIILNNENKTDNNERINFDYYSVIKDKNLLEKVKDTLLGFNEFNDEILKHRWWIHIRRIFENKTMLLYAQKKYINDKFKDFNQFESIEDTNRPWDWDHIYPISWVYNKDGINPFVKYWVHSIGNFRALSYDENRSESNTLSPAERLEIKHTKEDGFFGDDEKYWKELNSNFKRITKDDLNLENFLNAVINRMVNIYGEWYENYYLNIS